MSEASTEEKPDLQRKQHSNAISLALFVVTFLLVITVGAASVLDNKAPSNVMFPEKGTPLHNSTSLIFRQGWGFFTRDPREPKASLYRQEGDRTEEVLLGVPTRSENFFGLSRAHRGFYSDLGAILSAAEESQIAWSECIGDISIALSTCIHGTDVEEIELSPLSQDICGSFVIAVERPIPFNYAGIVDYREARAKRVNVDCS